MSLIFGLFKLISTLISFYVLLIFIRVLFTWIPSMSYTSFGRLLASVCDPYLNWFKRFKFLRISAFDFSPILGIAVLLALSSVFQNFSLMQKFSIGILLGTFLSIIGSFLDSFISIINIILIIRLIANLLNKDHSDAWANLDKIITPILYKISGIFFPRKFFKYRNILIYSLIITILTQFLLKILFSSLIKLCVTLPL